MSVSCDHYKAMVVLVLVVGVGGWGGAGRWWSDRVAVVLAVALAVAGRFGGGSSTR